LANLLCISFSFFSASEESIVNANSSEPFLDLPNKAFLIFSPAFLAYSINALTSFLNDGKKPNESGPPSPNDTFPASLIALACVFNASLSIPLLLAPS
jgi:hypothetical protein